MATKHGRMVTYLDCFLPIKSNEYIVTWFCEITGQTKNTISPLPQHLARCGFTLSDFNP